MHSTAHKWLQKTFQSGWQSLQNKLSEKECVPSATGEGKNANLDSRELKEKE